MVKLQGGEEERGKQKETMGERELRKSRQKERGQIETSDKGRRKERQTGQKERGQMETKRRKDEKGRLIVT